MPTTEIEMSPFDAATATAADWAALLPFRQQLRAERLPDDPPPTLEQVIGEMRDVPPFIDIRRWVGRDPAGGAIVAHGMIGMLRTAENQHLAQFDIGVLTEFRRQGLGRQLLALLADTARQEARPLLLTTVYGNVPAGAAFMERIGARLGLTGTVNQLDMTQLDPALLASWQAQAQERAAGFTLGLWLGPYPDEDLAAMVEIKKVMNQQPFGDLDVEDFQWTGEQLRQIEAMLAQREQERWTMYLRETATGALAGYTEIIWDPARPQIAHQQDTAVLPQYRNQGLGRWLKAAMLAKLAQERPQVRWVRTENADANAPMLKINEELGFRPYKSDSLWQVETVRVQEYLAGRATVPAR